MTGHYIFTRANYEYGSRSANPGTWIVELTDNIFAPDPIDITLNKITHIYTETQPSIAGYNMEQAMLRIFHPTVDSTSVSRSFFINDEITDRGVVQYSYGLLFTKEDNGIFLSSSQKAFDISSFESYAELVTRVREDGTIVYSNKYDPNPIDYNKPLYYLRDHWTGLGFNEEIFTSFFISLGKAITSPKNDQKIAVLLPAGSDGDTLILTIISILPMWLRVKFGAVSRWAGVMDSGNTRAIDGMQLVCYTGVTPPRDTRSVVIDLTGNNNHKNIESITSEQRDLAKWYWENIDKPDELETLSAHMYSKYGQIIDKMPFTVFAHCFWLWMTFIVNFKRDEVLPFNTASRAINSLVSAFGINFKKYYSNNFMLQSIFSAFKDNLANVSVNDINEDTIQAAYVLAVSDFQLQPYQIYFRDNLKPLFVKFSSAQEWIKIEPILKYYVKILHDDTPADRVNEALDVFGQTLKCRDKNIADQAAAVLSKYANSCVEVLFTKNEKSRFETYKTLANQLKNAGRQVIFDVSSWDDAIKNETASSYFYLIEKNCREKLSNIRPPSIKQLRNVLDGIKWLSSEKKAEVLQDLLTTYWASDELKDPVQKQKYTRYLDENNELSLFIKHNAGIDDIREQYKDEINKLFDTGNFLSDDEKITVLSQWQKKLSNMCFEKQDKIFSHLFDKSSVIDLINTPDLLASLLPQTINLLGALFKEFMSEKTNNNIDAIHTFDDIAGQKDKFFLIFKDNSFKYADEFILKRMKFWLKRDPDPPVEWALSYVLLNFKMNRTPISGAIFFQYLKNTQNEINKLISLYEVLYLIRENGGYKREDRDLILFWVKSEIKDCIELLCDNNLIGDVFDSAVKFQELFKKDIIHDAFKIMSPSIVTQLKSQCAAKKIKIPDEVLRNFNDVKKPDNKKINRSLLVESLLSIASFMMLLAGTVCFIILETSAEGFIKPVSLYVPFWLMFVITFSMLVACIFLVLNVLAVSSGSGRKSI